MNLVIVNGIPKGKGVEFEETLLEIIQEKEEVYIVKFANLRMKRTFEVHKKLLETVVEKPKFPGVYVMYQLYAFENDVEEAKKNIRMSIVEDMKEEVRKLETRIQRYEQEEDES